IPESKTNSVTATVLTDCRSSTHTQIGVWHPTPDSRRNGSPPSSKARVTDALGNVVRRSWPTRRPASMRSSPAFSGSSPRGILHLSGMSHLTGYCPMDRKRTGLNRIDHIVDDLQFQDVSGTDHVLLPSLSIIAVDAA